MTVTSTIQDTNKHWFAPISIQQVMLGLILPPFITRLDFKSKEELQSMPQTEEEHLENQNLDYEDQEKSHPDAEVTDVSHSHSIYTSNASKLHFFAKQHFFFSSHETLRCEAKRFPIKIPNYHNLSLSLSIYIHLSHFNLDLLLYFIYFHTPSACLSNRTKNKQTKYSSLVSFHRLQCCDENR